MPPSISSGGSCRQVKPGRKPGGLLPAANSGEEEPCDGGRILGTDWEPSAIGGSDWAGTICDRGPDGRRRRGAAAGASSTAGLRSDGTERETSLRAPKDAELGRALLPASVLEALSSARERRISSFFDRSWPPLYKPCCRSTAESSAWRRGGRLPDAEAAACAVEMVSMFGTDTDARNERRPDGWI